MAEALLVFSVVVASVSSAVIFVAVAIYLLRELARG